MITDFIYNNKQGWDQMSEMVLLPDEEIMSEIGVWFTPEEVKNFINKELKNANT